MRPLRSHHGLDGVPPLQNISDIGAFGGNGFGSGEATTRVVLHALDDAKRARLPAAVELRSDFLIRRFAHAATKGIAEDHPLVRYSLALEDAFTGEGNRFFGERLLLWLTVQLSCAFAGCGDNPLRLISEGDGHFLMGCKNLSRKERLFPIPCRMRRDLRRLWAAVAAFFELLSDLPRPWAGGIKILLGIPLISGAPLLPDSIS